MSVSISQQEIPWCQNGNVELTAVSATAVSYSWSTGETATTIEATPATSYSVTVADANGCTASATRVTTTPVDLLSSYVILAKIRVELNKNTVYSGGVGVTNPLDQIELNNGTKITAPGTFARADVIKITGGSQATTQIHSPAPVSWPPPFEYNPYCSTASISNVSVPDNATMTLNGSVYKNIMIGKNCTVTFTQQNIYALSIYVKDNSKIKFANCTRIRICKKLDLDNKVVFNPDTSEVIVYAKDGIDIGPGSKVIADLYTISGRLRVDKATASAPTIMRGLFIANNVHANDYTYWYSNPDCDNACRLNSPAPSAKLNAPDELNSLNMATFEEEVLLKAYPNPFSNLLNLEFSLPESSRVTLELYSISGQRINVLFEGNAEAGKLYQFQYLPDERASSGLVLYRLQTQSGIYFGKAVLVR